MSKSTVKTPVPPGGAAESAAVDPGLLLVIKSWPVLTPHFRSTIVGMARQAAADALNHSRWL